MDSNPAQCLASLPPALASQALDSQAVPLETHLLCLANLQVGTKVLLQSLLFTPYTAGCTLNLTPCLCLLRSTLVQKYTDYDMTILFLGCRCSLLNQMPSPYMLKFYEHRIQVLPVFPICICTGIYRLPSSQNWLYLRKRKLRSLP